MSPPWRIAQHEPREVSEGASAALAMGSAAFAGAVGALAGVAEAARASQGNGPLSKDDALPESSELLRPGEALDFSDSVVRRLSLSDEVLGPVPSGALFKCAYCSELVFESQLDYHVALCPAPQDSRSSEPLSPGTDGASGSTRPRPKSADATLGRGRRQHSQAMNRSVGAGASSSSSLPQDSMNSPNSADFIGSSAGQQQRVWRQWQDSEIQTHQAEAEARTSKRRQQLMDEIQKREEEQCTFTPRLISRQSRSVGRLSGSVCSERSCASGAPSTVEGAAAVLRRTSSAAGPSGGWQSERRRSAEAEMYAEVKFRPQISRFAERWARAKERSGEASAERQTVFERLYQVAIEERTKREEARKQREAADADSQLGWAGSSTDAGSSSATGQ
ncbi:unnamed protein product, partial [Polarella glacialis]